MNKLNVLGETDILESCEGLNLSLGVKMLGSVTPESCTGLNVLKYINNNNLSEICPNVIMAFKI